MWQPFRRDFWLVQMVSWGGRGSTTVQDSVIFRSLLCVLLCCSLLLFPTQHSLLPDRLAAREVMRILGDKIASTLVAQDAGVSCTRSSRDSGYRT